MIGGGISGVGFRLLEIFQTYLPHLVPLPPSKPKCDKFPTVKFRNTPCYSVGSADCGVAVFNVLEAEQQCHLLIHQDHTSTFAKELVKRSLSRPLIEFRTILASLYTMSSPPPPVQPQELSCRLLPEKDIVGTRLWMIANTTGAIGAIM